MLDHDDGVVLIAETLERVEKLALIAVMQADTGLIQHVNTVYQSAADLGGQPYPLRLSARQRRSATVEVQVAQTDFVQEPQPDADLLQSILGYLQLSGG